MLYLTISLLALWSYWKYSRLCFIRLVAFSGRRVKLSLIQQTNFGCLGFQREGTTGKCIVETFTVRSLALLTLSVNTFSVLNQHYWHPGSAASGVVGFITALVWLVSQVVALFALWSAHRDNYLALLEAYKHEDTQKVLTGSLSLAVTQSGWFSLATACVTVYRTDSASVHLWAGSFVVWLVLALIKLIRNETKVGALR